MATTGTIGTTWEDGGTDYWEDLERETVQELLPDDQSADPTEVQLAESFAVASEANRTLQEAREAVRQVRQSRGYYASESTSGKGIMPPASSSPTASSTASNLKGTGKLRLEKAMAHVLSVG